MRVKNKKALKQQLWNITNELRGKMDVDEFRNYILGFIFYKYLSEKFEDFAKNLLEKDALYIVVFNIFSIKLIIILYH